MFKLWPLIYVDFSGWFRPSKTSHHAPQKWKARPDFKRFDLCVVTLEACVPVGEPKPWCGRRLWFYWKDAGVIYARHFDWIWFPRWRRAVSAGDKHGG